MQPIHEVCPQVDSQALTARRSAMPYANPQSLVSTAALAASLGRPNLVVVDATYFLPMQGRNARAEYEQKHIPGAVFFDIDAIADKANPLPHMLPDAATFAVAAGELG